MAKPVVLLAMSPMMTMDLWTDAELDRLAAAAVLKSRERIGDLGGSPEELLSDVEVLVTGWGCLPLDESVLSRMPALKAVVHAAGTIKMHITDACWERGLRVTAAAAANALPVAEYTLAAILMANKRMFQIERRYRQERGFVWWPAAFPGLGNYRKTIGIVGASFVGRRVLDLLRPFDFEILVYDPYFNAEQIREIAGPTARKAELDDLVRQSDVISLHAPALLDTYQMIDRRRLGLMKEGATLINTARGWLVDGDALIDELRTGRIFAVIDTTEPEVLPTDSPLYDLPNLFLTPHIAGAMGTETERMATLAVDEVERYVRGEAFRYEIRREDLARVA